MVELKNFYLHAVYGNDGEPFNREKSIQNLERILQSGYILSRRKMKDTDKSKGGWNGLDYISICDYSKKDAPPFENKKFYRGYTAYNMYISTSIALILKKQGIRAIIPTLMPPAVFDYESLQEMRYLGNHPTQRFSDLPDEVQVKNQITLSKMVGLTLPIHYMTKEIKEKTYTSEEILNVLRDVQELLRDYHREDPIYDLETQIELKGKEEIEYVLRK